MKEETLMDLILKRRSVRKYTEEALTDEQIEAVVRAGLLAPSGKNAKPCRLIVVRDRAVLEKLPGIKAAGGAFLKDAAAAIVVSGDTRVSDTWIEDCSIALSFMMLAAAEQGLGSCWTQVHLRKDAAGKDAEDNLRELLNMEPQLRTVGILALGIPQKEPEAHRPEDADFGQVRVV